MIVNRKTVDPSDKSSPDVVQLETAMGAAIDVFDGARALRVPRRRFAPVKTTSDLLALRSDAYTITDDARVELGRGPRRRAGHRPRRRLLQAAARLRGALPRRARRRSSPATASRSRATSSSARDVTVRGAVTVEHDGDGRMRIEDGTVLEG